MFQSFFSSQANSKYLYLFSFSLIFTLRFAGTAKSTIRQVLFSFLFFSFLFLLTITISGLVVGIKLSVCISKSEIILCVSFSETHPDLCMKHFRVWSNLNFLHDSKWTTFPTQSPRFYFLLLLFNSFRVFHISVSWGFPTGVWVTASLLDSPGLFSVFWPISTIL